jgi:hypothetical protein
MEFGKGLVKKEISKSFMVVDSFWVVSVGFWAAGCLCDV